MHMPFCTVADKCLRCDNVRANREIRRLREVLRVTLDELIAEREEVKDLNVKVAAFQKQLFEIRATIDLVKLGKLSVTSLPSSVEAKQWAKLRGQPKSVMQGIFC
ncbi:hypothetical protein LCGC14_1910750 [marine sediment metagenome]|uniref:Uncharacterized protein n=1 Tax=marine sediment metagenome TaxID=412755 RepID=A0A0F9I7Q3_9ZZZZ